MNLKRCLTKACSPHQNHTKSRFVCASKHTVNTLRSSTKTEISQKDNVKETSPCFNSDAFRHNYFPQSAVVMTWVNRVSKSCCVVTKTNDIFSLLPLMVIFPLRVSAGPTGVRVTCFLCLSLEFQFWARDKGEAEGEHGEKGCSNYLIGHLWSVLCGDGLVTAL